MRIRVAVIVAALLCVPARLHAQAPRFVEDWGDTPGAGGLPAKWSFYGREAKIRFPPAVVVDDGRRALWLKTESYSVRLARATDVDVQHASTLTWEWKAVTLPEQGDVRGEISDQVARIVLFFPPRYRPRMLGYVWDTRAPVGTETHKTLTMFQRWLVVVRSGPADLGKWVRETRNVERDYTRLFGKAPPAPMAVGVESHSEDARHASEVFIGPITLGP
jgi:Protein of unknown function (DUF3047)